MFHPKWSQNDRPKAVQEDPKGDPMAAQGLPKATPVGTLKFERERQFPKPCPMVLPRHPKAVPGTENHPKLVRQSSQIDSEIIPHSSENHPKFICSSS